MTQTRSAAREAAYAALDSERDYQNTVWGVDGEPNPLTIGEFLLNIEEQVAKARAQWANEPKPEVMTLEFVRKIGGLTVNCMEQHGAPLRIFPRLPR